MKAIGLKINDGALLIPHYIFSADVTPSVSQVYFVGEHPTTLWPMQQSVASEREDVHHRRSPCTRRSRSYQHFLDVRARRNSGISRLVESQNTRSIEWRCTGRYCTITRTAVSTKAYTTPPHVTI